MVLSLASKIRSQKIFPSEFPAGEWLLQRAQDLNVEQSKPADLLLGRDLLFLGLEPGPVFGKIIHLANDLRDDHEYTQEKIIEVISGSKNTAEALARLEKLKEA